MNSSPIKLRFVAGLLAAVLQPLAARSQENGDKLREQATATMRKAAEYYRDKVALHGGYVYYYSPDLKLRHGEGAATRDANLGAAAGHADRRPCISGRLPATGDKFYLDAAREAGEALMLRPAQIRRLAELHRLRSERPRQSLSQRQRRRTEQLHARRQHLAVRHSLHGPARRALEFKDPKVHESATSRPRSTAQGAIQQRCLPANLDRPVPTVEMKKASYPDYDYRTEGKVKDYWNMYTLNDGLAGTVSETLLTAEAVYKDSRYRDGARKARRLFDSGANARSAAGAGRSNTAATCIPIWARRFEPAAITGGESQDVIETLMKIYRTTGDKKYLEPIPRALAYLKKSLLPDGRLARYYEMQTNRPLYMTRPRRRILADL